MYSPWVINNLLPGFPIQDLPPQRSMFSDLADSYDSTTNLNVMPNLNLAANGHKTRILNTVESPTPTTFSIR
jgi:hypothetical protein